VAVYTKLPEKKWLAILSLGSDSF